MKMTITLADLEAKGLARLEIACCDRCPYRGIYQVARLVEQLGRDHDLVSLRLVHGREVIFASHSFQVKKFTAWCRLQP
jgi:hypothetical protein